MGMEIEWDQEKDAQNRAKHGIRLGQATGLDWAFGVHVPDKRFAYGEDRMLLYALRLGRLHACV